MAVGRVVIVGTGPAGAALAYLLARRGVAVTLLERHSSFERTFRGDGLQPSGIDALGFIPRSIPQPAVLARLTFSPASIRPSISTWARRSAT